MEKRRLTCDLQYHFFGEVGTCVVCSTETEMVLISQSKREGEEVQEFLGNVCMECYMSAPKRLKAIMGH